MDFISVAQFAAKHRVSEHIYGYLTDTCLTAQDEFKTFLDYFNIKY